MTDVCKQYTPEQISRYVDNELPPDLYQAITDHQKCCPACKRLIQSYRDLGNTFSSYTDRQVSGLTVPNPTADDPHPKVPLFRRLFGKKIYLKLASIVAIVVVSLAVYQGFPTGPSGPSAIVQSVDTDVASVMIIETEKQKHTIIWFSETGSG